MGVRLINLKDHMKVHVFIFLVLISNWATSNTLSKVSTSDWTVELVGSSDRYSDDCTLDLIARNASVDFKLNFKHEIYGCRLMRFTKITLLPSDSSKYIAIIELSRGGDGDNTGPLISIVNISEDGLEKVSEIQAYLPRFFEDDQRFEKITAKLLFGFQNGYDPDLIDPQDNFYLPVEIRLGCSGICVVSTLSRDESDLMHKKYLERKDNYKTIRNLEILPDYILKKEKEFLAYLGKA